MATEKQAALVSRGAVLGAELNSLAAGSRSAVGAEVAQGTNLDSTGLFVLNVTFGSAPSASSPSVEIYEVFNPAGDGYVDGSNTVDPGAALLVARIPVRSVTTPQRIPSGTFRPKAANTKYLLVNGTGVAFPASGSALTLYTTNRTVA